MTNLRLVTLLVVLLTIGPSSIISLFEDQAGTYDW